MRISDWSSDVCSSDLQCRKAVGTAPGAHQMVGTGFAGRVWRTGRIRRGLGEQVFGAFQVAIDLVGGNMMKTESRLVFFTQAHPVLPRRLQQRVGADDIGFNKREDRKRTRLNSSN